MTPETPADSDASELAGIDRVIHEPARLLIVAQLYVIAEADFIFLEQQTRLTRGNLSSHLRKLEDVDYVAIEKKFVDRVPRTVVALTDQGRSTFELYRQTMLEFLER